MARTQLGSTVLPAAALTTQQVAEGMQPGSNQQLIMYGIQSAVDTETTERIKFMFAGGLSQDYAQADYQFLFDINGDEYFYGTVCIKLHPGRKTGSGPDWRYAISPPSGVILPTAYTV